MWKRRIWPCVCLYFVDNVVICLHLKVLIQVWLRWGQGYEVIIASKETHSGQGAKGCGCGIICRPVSFFVLISHYEMISVILRLVEVQMSQMTWNLNSLIGTNSGYFSVSFHRKTFVISKDIGISILGDKMTFSLNDWESCNQKATMLWCSFLYKLWKERGNYSSNYHLNRYFSI